MRKKLAGVLSMVTMLGCMDITAYASLQKPFDWKGYVNNSTFDWDENTAVEMKNGDGTDVMSVNGTYIHNNMLPGTNWPFGQGGGLPDNLKSVSCQVVKEDAYIIMPFDGYVTIGIEDQILAGDYGDICVRAKAGDKVNMVPQNLVATYDVNNPDSISHFINTTADDWTYNLKIYKETFASLQGNSSDYSRKIDELISIPLNNEGHTLSCLWFLYQVDAPNTTIKAAGINRDEINNLKEGWVESTRVKGAWEYYVKTEYNWSYNAIGSYYINRDNPYDYSKNDISIPYDMYQSGQITVKDHDLYIDGYKMNSWPGVWIDPRYNIVNAQ